jgi:hypothetical protein
MGETPKVKEASRKTRVKWVLDPTTGEIKPKQQPTTDPQADPEPQPAPFRAAELTDD